MGRLLDIIIGIALVGYLIRRVLGRSFQKADKRGRKTYPRGEVFPKVDVYEFPKENRPTPAQPARPQYQTVSGPAEFLETIPEPEYAPELVEGGYKSVKDIVAERQPQENSNLETEQAQKEKIDAKKMIIYSEILKSKYK